MPTELAIADNPRAVVGNEIWLTVGVAPEYAISNHGRIKRQKAGRTRKADTFLRPTLRRAKDGYLSVCLRVAGRSKTFFLHCLVCEAFHGQKPTDLHQAAHWDGDKFNNLADNLRWATPKENAADKVRHGTVPNVRHGTVPIEHWSRLHPERIVRGERIGTSKLTNADAIAIKNEPGYHGVTVALGKRYGVSNVIVGRIRRGLQWSHVDA